MSKRRSPGQRPTAYEAPLPHEHAPLPPQEVPEPMDAQEASPAPTPTPRPQPRPKLHEADRIGDILRRVREHRGEDIESISDYLRIRPSFLIALESSHYEELPADAYVIGFLRTYALYLGLDGRGAIDQYRREMAGRRRKPQLSMPQPMSEGKTPTMAVLVAAAVAGLLIYGLWYGLSTPDREAVEKPVPLPSIAATIPETPATVPLATLPGETATPPAEAAVPSAQAPAPDKNKTPDKAPDKAAASAPAKPEAPSSTPTPQPATTDHKEAPKPQDAPKDSAPPATPEKPKEGVKDEPKTENFGTPGKSRVTVKADKESWVLITDSKGLTVFDRTLKPGESYNVPDGKGYNLTTGNVAGVSLELDGKALGKLPANGRVARNVSLEPDKIKARMAGKGGDSGTDNAPASDADKPVGIKIE